MDLLKERIMQEGRCFPGGILKVDSFVNHQMDPILMMDLAKEFVRLFQDIKYNKIITIEASGIAPAIMVGYLTHLPVVFVKKKQPKTGGYDYFCGSLFHQGPRLYGLCERQLSYSRRPCHLHR